ncbi:putative esterase YcpF (UPF0227 family) [Psychrobacter sp. PL19]|uniref:YqiA/YcfP family alpha/beta fold hydrolase n=1 Tax=Psychrobacter sp. PL19 TaxID=2760711 RepID=UPI001AEA7C5D
MNIVYIHGLDSDANSTKGTLLERYCQQYFPEIIVFRPDFNQPPAEVFKQLNRLITKLKSESDHSNKESMSNTLTKTVLVGSSLGGYFATLVSNNTGCPVLLLNPSTQPHITLQRFSNQPPLQDTNKNISSINQVLHTTVGGWTITGGDLQWFADHLLSVKYPQKMVVWIKEGDELLNPQLSAEFYRQQGAEVTLQAGGDHRFTDFAEQLPIVIKILQQLG